MRASDIAFYNNQKPSDEKNMSPISTNTSPKVGAQRHKNRDLFPELYKQVLAGKMTGAALCSELGISKTAYRKWVREYEAQHPTPTTSLRLNLRTYPGYFSQEKCEEYIKYRDIVRSANTKQIIQKVNDDPYSTQLSSEYDWICNHINSLPVGETWPHGELLALVGIMKDFLEKLDKVNTSIVNNSSPVTLL